MKVLEYNQLTTAGVVKQYRKILEAIKRDDFYTAEVKKLVGTPFYRAKLDYTNRLLFQMIQYQGEKYALMLEVIYQHDYSKSRFLNGAEVKEEDIKSVGESQHIPEISYINPARSYFNILDKIVSFDEKQSDIFEQSLPLILIGGAGSGKTTLTLEKIKQLTGDILYVTHSPYLVEHSQALYYSQNYSNEDQNIDFLSFKELLETIRIPEGYLMDYSKFRPWFTRHQHALRLKDSHQVFEEFRGVLTGSDTKKSYLSRQDYLGLGIRQSIFNTDERSRVYDCFERYLAYLKESNAYDPNIITHEYIRLLEARYDYVVLDEVQDFTNIQIHFILQLCHQKGRFILCGDSNQIVHPNFFSWAKVKTMFFEDNAVSGHENLQILHVNYRNSYKVTEIANRILKVKQQRFGSIDKESNYLVTTHSETPGEIYCVLCKDKVLSEINQLTRLSMRFAILVMKDEDKEAARKIFRTPLVFSIHEAKGLEYQNIVLFNFISGEADTFSEISEGISIADLEKEHTYARSRNKGDKSLEAYKFYINSFYVAITRSLKNLYVIESKPHHPFLSLIGLKEFQPDLIPQKEEQSSIEEWQKEAHRLELQGKTEQAEAIRIEILKQKVPNWPVMTAAEIHSLYEKDKKDHSLNKAQRLLLLECAIVSSEEHIIEHLQEINFHPAQNIGRAKKFIYDKYYLDFSFKNISKVERLISEYGVDFRNQFNETPLMVAVKAGNEILVSRLAALGANPLLKNNRGLNALQILFQDENKGSARGKSIYDLLATQSLSIEVDGRLIKIDPRKMEFFLFQFIASVFARDCHIALQRKQSDVPFTGITAAQLETLLKEFSFLPEYRKRKQYISGMLQKNQMFGRNPYNKRLFMRTRIGYYTINPELKIKEGDRWISFYDSIEVNVKKLNPAIPQWLKTGKAEYSALLSQMNHFGSKK